uniref:D-aspartate oxidase n=1 Tax=Cacopsylla melanoneura TaxID=428564 RepID=A0A8D9E5J0_9HEMI
MDIKDLKLCIIGAGVVGLNTALELQAVYPSCNLTIIAKEFTINTTSHGAAGIFRPGISFSGPTDEVTLKWIEDSYHFYSKLLLEARAGVRLISGYNLSNISSDLTKVSTVYLHTMSLWTMELFKIPPLRTWSQCTEMQHLKSCLSETKLSSMDPILKPLSLKTVTFYLGQ